MSIQIGRICPEETPDNRVYFSHEEITQVTFAGERGDPELVNVECPVLIAALEIPGVIAAKVSPYALVVMKTPVHKWEEIEPSVLRLMSSLNLGEGKLQAADNRQPPEPLQTK